MSNFSMILGINFLKKNGPKIDYQCKKVQFSLENENQFKFGKRHIKSMIINIIKAKKMLSMRRGGGCGT